MFQFDQKSYPGVLKFFFGACVGAPFGADKLRYGGRIETHWYCERSRYLKSSFPSDPGCY